MTSIRIMKEITREWQEIMDLAEKIPYGQIILRVNDKKVLLIEYTVQKKPGIPDDFEVKPL